MRFRRVGAGLVVAAMVSTCSGCTQEDLAQLDQNGDGFISSGELFGALVNRFCPAEEETDPGEEPDAEEEQPVE